MLPTIVDYNSQHAEYEELCTTLCTLIDMQLAHATSKVWHGHPVWFLNDNPIVGYAIRKQGVQLLFWSGQSFDEPELEPEGTFKAAQKYYRSPEEVHPDGLKRWLEKASLIQWDYKNIVKRKGVLERLK